METSGLDLVSGASSIACQNMFLSDDVYSAIFRSLSTQENELSLTTIIEAAEKSAGGLNFFDTDQLF